MTDTTDKPVVEAPNQIAAPAVKAIDPAPAVKICSECPIHQKPLAMLLNRVLNPVTPLGHKLQGAFLALLLIYFAQWSGIATADQIRKGVQFVLAAFIGT